MLTVVERSRGIFFSPFLYTLLFYMEQMIRTMTWKAGKQEVLISAKCLAPLPLLDIRCITWLFGAVDERFVGPPSEAES